MPFAAAVCQNPAMQPLITGSLAYDCLAHVVGKFADGVAAHVAPSLRRAPGGCAGNIAYALRRLGDAPTLMATAGGDFADYAAHLRRYDVDDAHVLVLAEMYTAQAFVATDADGAQFTVFHPGATGEAHRQRVADAPPSPLAIVAPNGKEGMLQHCRDLAAGGTPFIFDPGQMLGQFSAEQLRDCLAQCAYAIFNADEFALFQKMTSLTQAEVAATVRALLLTHGADGSEVFADGVVECVGAVRLGDGNPTGCGDAYRAGIIHALLRGWEWEKTIRFASVVAGLKAASDNPQGYDLSAESALAILRREFSQEE